MFNIETYNIQKECYTKENAKNALNLNNDVWNNIKSWNKRNKYKPKVFSNLSYYQSGSFNMPLVTEYTSLN